MGWGEVTCVWVRLDLPAKTYGNEYSFTLTNYCHQITTRKLTNKD